MSSRRNRDRSKTALAKLEELPPVSYEEVAQATYGHSDSEIIKQFFGESASAGGGESAIEVIGDGSLRAFDYRLTGVGLDPAALPSERSQWEQLGQLLFRFDHSLQWLIGDWLLQGESNHWGQHEQIADELGYQVKTLYDYRYVARNVPFGLRSDALSFGHHKLVAHLDAARQERWLAKAAAGDRDAATGQARPWSISRFRRELKALPASLPSEETPFERNLRRIDRELTRKMWNKLGTEQRRNRYHSLREILLRMERWGID